MVRPAIELRRKRKSEFKFNPKNAVRVSENGAVVALPSI
jgi:hypothetical protein